MSESKKQWSSIAAGAAVAVLVVAGVGHQLLAKKIDAMLNEYLRPKQPLSAVPLELGSWAGSEVPMDPKTKRVAGDDDCINREYRNKSSGREASIYVGYIGRPRSRMGHRPDVCYRVHGYKEVSRSTDEIPVPGSEPVPVLLYEYAPPSLGGAQQLVLATFCVNGRWVNDTESANAYNVRGPALFSRQVAYVSRVQVSILASGDHQADLQALKGLAALIVEQVQQQLPD